MRRWPRLVAMLVAGTTAAGCSGGSTATTSTVTDTATATATQRVHAVGVVTDTFVDATRSTVAWGPDPAVPTRTLITTIWYPATGSPDRPPRVGAAPDQRRGGYPLIVFAHGLGADPPQYQRLLSYWASAGFVVAAPQFPLTSDHTKGGPDAGDVVNQPRDMSFVMTSVVKASAGTDGVLAGMVDPLEIGAAGHSNGAITTLGLIANSCCRDRRVNAAVVMAGDDVAFPGGTYDLADTPPLLLVHGTADELLPYTLAIGMFNEARGPKGLVTIEGGDHESAAGLVASSSSSVLRATTDFFTAYLRNDPTALAHIAGDGQHGVTAVRFAPKVGSTATIPLPPAPKRDLHATATPATGLVDGQSVTVRWSGYTPGKVVNILQCAPTVVQSNSSSACAFANAKILTPDPAGHGSVQLKIVTGTVGSGVCDTAHPGCLDRRQRRQLDGSDCIREDPDRLRALSRPAAATAGRPSGGSGQHRPPVPAPAQRLLGHHPESGPSQLLAEGRLVPVDEPPALLLCVGHRLMPRGPTQSGDEQQGPPRLRDPPELVEDLVGVLVGDVEQRRHVPDPVEEPGTDGKVPEVGLDDPTAEVLGGDREHSGRDVHAHRPTALRCQAGAVEGRPASQVSDQPPWWQAGEEGRLEPKEPVGVTGRQSLLAVGVPTGDAVVGRPVGRRGVGRSRGIRLRNWHRQMMPLFSSAGTHGRSGPMRPVRSDRLHPCGWRSMSGPAPPPPGSAACTTGPWWSG